MENNIILTTEKELKKFSESIIENALNNYEKNKQKNKTYYVNQVAKILHKSPHTIKKLIESGYIRTTTNGLITQGALDEFLNKTDD